MGVGAMVEADAREALARSQEELERLSHQLLRLQADFDNFRRRARAEAERAADEAVARVARGLVAVVDDLERALAAIREQDGGRPEAWSRLASGVEMVHRALLRLLADEQIGRMAALGEMFDPALHQVVERVQVADPSEDMRVVQEIQPGYLFKGRVLRPSLVKVGVYAPRQEAPQGEAAAEGEAGAAGTAGASGPD